MYTIHKNIKKNILFFTKDGRLKDCRLAGTLGDFDLRHVLQRLGLLQAQLVGTEPRDALQSHVHRIGNGDRLAPACCRRLEVLQGGSKIMLFFNLSSGI